MEVGLSEGAEGIAIIIVLFLFIVVNAVLLIPDIHYYGIIYHCMNYFVSSMSAVSVGWLRGFRVKGAYTWRIASPKPESLNPEP